MINRLATVPRCQWVVNTCIHVQQSRSTCSRAPAADSTWLDNDVTSKNRSSFDTTSQSINVKAFCSLLQSCLMSNRPICLCPKSCECVKFTIWNNHLYDGTISKCSCCIFKLHVTNQRQSFMLLITGRVVNIIAALTWTACSSLAASRGRYEPIRVRSAPRLAPRRCSGCRSYSATARITWHSLKPAAISRKYEIR